MSTMILPIGIEDFGRIVRRKLDFIDKTLLIKAIFDDKGSDVFVITRPRRFGKTLNLSMLHHFLAAEVYGEKTAGLFAGLNIAQCGDEYMQHQGKYPVIAMSFKDIKETRYELAFKHLSELMARTYHEHIYLLQSDRLSSYQKKDFELVLERKKDETALKSALLNLMQYLFTHHGVKPWLLMDEYDTPIQSGYLHGYYAEIIDFMRGVLGVCLKTNPYLEKAVITGILRVAKESLFSGLNNLKVYSLLSSRYSEYFGFTENEVEGALQQAGLMSKAKAIKQWYNGYKVGNTIIYNPWSIVNCIGEKGVLKPYWVNTSDNQLIKDLLQKSPLSFKKELEALLRGEKVEKLIDENLVFHYLNNSALSVWNLLLLAGYLKLVSSRETAQGTLAVLAVPNREVRNLYQQIIEQWLSTGDEIEGYNAFIHALITGNIDDFKRRLETVMVQIASYHDFAKEPEAFYQGLMLGFTVSLHGAGGYEIYSNRESGLGRFDIMLVPKQAAKLGIVLELKSSLPNEDLQAVAAEALRQIDDKHYLEALKSKGLKTALKIGIGFCGKVFALCSARENLPNKASPT